MLLCWWSDERGDDLRGAISQLVEGVAIVLALGQCRIGSALALELSSVLINGKVRVDEVGDGKGGALSLRSSSGCGDHAGDQERKRNEALHIDTVLETFG
jgi:hypothetical protein